MDRLVLIVCVPVPLNFELRTLLPVGNEAIMTPPIFGLFVVTSISKMSRYI